MAQKVLECNRVSIFLKDKKSGQLEVKVSSGEVARLRFGPGEGVAGQVFKAGRIILVPDVDNYRKFIKPEASAFVVKSMVASPIRLENQSIGVICADMDQLDWFDEFNEKLIETLANQATITIKNYSISTIVPTCGKRRSSISAIRWVDDSTRRKTRF